MAASRVTNGGTGSDSEAGSRGLMGGIAATSIGGMANAGVGCDHWAAGAADHGGGAPPRWRPPRLAGRSGAAAAMGAASPRHPLKHMARIAPRRARLARSPPQPHGWPATSARLPRRHAAQLHARFGPHRMRHAVPLDWLRGCSPVMPLALFKARWCHRLCRPESATMPMLRWAVSHILCLSKPRAEDWPRAAAGALPAAGARLVAAAGRRS